MAIRNNNLSSRKIYIGTNTEVVPNDGDALISGNVGIGTTSPTNAKVHIVGDGSYVGNVGYNTLTLEDSSGYPGLNLRSGNNNWLIRKTGNNHNLEFYYSDDASAQGTGTYSNKFVIESGGNVGIGTTDPDYKLDISAAARAHGVRIGRDFSIADRGTVRIDANGLDKPADVLFGHTAAANEGGWNGVYWSLSSRGTEDNGKFQLWRGSGHAAPYNSELRVITALPNGNVGIGANDPQNKLHVYGGRIVLDNALAAQSAMQFNHAGTEMGVLYRPSGYSNQLRFFMTGAGDTMTLNSSGNVGIGTTSPSGRLELNGSGQSWSTAPGIRMWDSFNSKGWFVGSANNVTAGDFYIRTLPGEDTNPGSSQQEFTIKHASGNVGIGTTSPGEKLDVAGNIRLSGNVINASNTAYYLDLDGTSILNHGKFTSTLSFGNFSAGNQGTLFEGYSTHSVVRTDAARLDFYMGKTTTGVGTMMSLTDTGRVGIGITSPSATLHISDAAISSTTTFSANGRIKMRGDGVLLWGSSAQFGLLSWDTNKAIVGAQTGSALHLGASGNANHMVINTSGNVGIGTTSPSQKLEVSGNIAVSVDNRVIFDVDSDGFNYIKSDNANSEELTFYSVGPHHFKNGEDNSYENVIASNFVLSSDERLKENTYEIQNENINVNWKTFNFKNKPEEKRYGVVAQELEKDHPEFVNTDNQGFKSVKYIDLLIAKIAELEARLEKAGL